MDIKEDNSVIWSTTCQLQGLKITQACPVARTTTGSWTRPPIRGTILRSECFQTGPPWAETMDRELIWEATEGRRWTGEMWSKTISSTKKLSTWPTRDSRSSCRKRWSLSSSLTRKLAWISNMVDCGRKIKWKLILNRLKSIKRSKRYRRTWVRICFSSLEHSTSLWVH